CELPTPGRLGAFEVLGIDEPAPVAAGAGPREWRLTLVAFDPGTLDVPPIAVRVVRDTDGATSQAATAAARIDVTAVAMADEASLRPDEGPMDPGPDWRVVAGWTLGAALLLAAAALAWRWWRRRPRKQAPPAPPVSAERAIAAIRAIAGSPARSPDEVLERYRALSNALRGYLGLPLEVPAKALTSTELVRAIDGLRGRPRVDPRAGASGRPPRPPLADDERHHRTRALLEHVDDVKFGGARPPEATRADACRRAIALVEELERGRTGAGGAPRGVA
nr:hypothetical protein [Vicinamibacterales bacterium]